MVETRASSAAFVTPERPQTIVFADPFEISPPPPPEKSVARFSRVEQLSHLVERTALAALNAWRAAPEEVAKSVKAAGSSIKKGLKPMPASAANAAANKSPAEEAAKPAVTRAKAAAPAAAKGAGKAKAAKKKANNAQTQSELEGALRAGHIATKAGVEATAAAACDAATKKGAGKKGPKCNATADPLLRHGYITQGPIAAGAFSTIVRAKNARSSLEVAVKSFDNAKCKKDYQHLYLREGELNALRAAKSKIQPSRWIANLVEEHVGPNYTYAILGARVRTHQTRHTAHARAAWCDVNLTPCTRPPPPSLTRTIARPLRARAEYCAGGSLMRHLQKLQTKGRKGDPLAMSEAEVRRLGAQVNAALAHLHRLDIAHRDLKPGNVLFYGPDTNHLKLCDFGFAKRCRGQRLHTICGTPIYMAPELTQESKKGYMGHPVDMWAFGALLYEMLHNRVAFNAISELQLHQRIRSGKHAPFRKGTDKKLTQLISSLLEVAPAKRMAAESAASHACFRGAESLDSRRSAARTPADDELES